MATQTEPAAVARALQHELDVGVARRRGVERGGERDRHRDAAAVVARRGTEVGAGELEQQRQREHEADGRDQLQDADRRALAALEAQHGDDQQPDQGEREPPEPAGGAAAGQPVEPGAQGPQAGAVDETRASGVVVGGDDQVARGRGSRSRLRLRLWDSRPPRPQGADDVLARALGGQPPPERDAEQLVGDHRQQRDEHERAADARRVDREQAAGETEGRVPGVRERPVGPAPERLDPSLRRGVSSCRASHVAARRSAFVPAPRRANAARASIVSAGRIGPRSSQLHRRHPSGRTGRVTEIDEEELLAVAREAAEAARGELRGALRPPRPRRAVEEHADRPRLGRGPGGRGGDPRRARPRPPGRRDPRRGGRGDRAERRGLRWVVDPLDGTINYLFGIPMFAVSVACEDADGDARRRRARPDPRRVLHGHPLGRADAERRADSRVREEGPRDGADRDRLRLRRPRPRPPGRGGQPRAAPGARHPPGRRRRDRPLLVRLRPLRRLLRAGRAALGRRGGRADRRSAPASSCASWPPARRIRGDWSPARPGWWTSCGGWRGASGSGRVLAGAGRPAAARRGRAGRCRRGAGVIWGH